MILHVSHRLGCFCPFNSAPNTGQRPSCWRLASVHGHFITSNTTIDNGSSTPHTQSIILITLNLYQYQCSTLYMHNNCFQLCNSYSTVARDLSLKTILRPTAQPKAERLFSMIILWLPCYNYFISYLEKRGNINILR